MHPPTTLPSPPHNKPGWPWTTPSAPLPPRLPDGRPWPRLTVVTPSYNQGPFLEATIRSVLQQGYPNLEYIVIDGGSSDESVEIIRRYEPWLAYWVSEKDEGQSDAINKGFAQATGEIMGWLNSDDIYEPDALGVVGNYFAAHPECALLYGNGWYIDEDGRKTEFCDWIRPFDRRLYLNSNFILQPAALWRRSLWQQVGALDPNCHWAMDWEWFLRATAVTQPHYLPTDLASWRIRPDIKTQYGGPARRAEIAAISVKYGGFWQPTNLVYQLDRLSSGIRERLGNGRVRRLFDYLATPVRRLVKDRLWPRRYQN
jgi:glycosyltransferase involved in cell wall biosynthesis